MKCAIPLKLNKWAKNIVKSDRQHSYTNSESKHVNSLQRKPIEQLITENIKPWNDIQVEKLLHNIFKNKSSFLWHYTYHIHKPAVNLYQYLRKTNQAPHSTVFFELSKDLSKINKKLKTISFDNQNQSSILLKGCSFFHRVTLSIMYSIKDNTFSKKKFVTTFHKIAELYLSQIATDRPYYRSDKKLNNEYIKKIGENEEFIELLGEVINILRHYCIKMESYGKYTLKPKLLCSLGVSSIPASIIEGSNIQSQSQHLYR